MSASKGRLPVGRAGEDAPLRVRLLAPGPAAGSDRPTADKLRCAVVSVPTPEPWVQAWWLDRDLWQVAAADPLEVVVLPGRTLNSGNVVLIEWDSLQGVRRLTVDPHARRTQDGGVVELVFPDMTRRLRGRVVRDGAPVAGATVIAFPASSSGACDAYVVQPLSSADGTVHHAAIGRQTAHSDAEGRFDMATVAGEADVLEAWTRDGFARIVLEEEDLEESVEVLLQPLAVVRVVVELADALAALQPGMGIPVRVRIGPSAHDLWSHVPGGAQADAEFRLPHGPWKIELLDRWGNVVARHELEVGRSMAIRAHVRGASWQFE